jgi:hypothetical protein
MFQRFIDKFAAQMQGRKCIMSGSQLKKGSDERRSEGRVATIYRPVLVETADFAGFCLVRNLSPTGMKGQIYTSLAVGTSIQVEFAESLIATGKVVWCREDEIGINFDLQIDVNTVLTSLSHPTHQGNPARAPRLPLQVTGTAVVDNRHIPFELHDISQKGLKIHSTALRIDDEVTVCLPGFEDRKAIVRWTQADMAGLNFYRPIPYDSLGEWVIRQQLGEKLFEQPVIGNRG